MEFFDLALIEAKFRFIMEDVAETVSEPINLLLSALFAFKCMFTASFRICLIVF